MSQPPPTTPVQPPKRFLPALVTASDSVRVGGSNMDATPSQVQAFEDYKRKHSKQNRDIIKSNAERALRIRSLEDENTFLQMEILNVRHEKSIVAEALKREKQRSGKIRDNPEVKQALDVLLLAIPQITQLRSLLSSTPSSSSRRTSSHLSSPSDQGKGRANNLRTRSRGLEPEPIAKKLDIQKWLNRPGIVKAGTPNLQNLAEGVEEESDELTEVEKVVERTQSNPVANAIKPAGRRQSGLFRPMPNDTEQQGQNHESGPASSSSSSYPQDIFDVRKSPKKTSTPSSVSSDIVPRQQVSADSEPTRRSPRKKATRPNYADDAEESPVKGRGASGSVSAAVSPTKPVVRKRRSLKPVEGGLALRLETPAEAGLVDIQDMEEERASAERVEEVLVRNSREATPPSALHEQTLMRMAKAASVPVVPPVLVTPAEDTDADAREEEEAGGRQRRARKSVNYKEPNLHFKMRKPEAVVNGHLYVSGPAASSTSRARSSTPSSTPGRKPSQSVVADTDVPPVPSVSLALRAEAGIKGNTLGSGVNSLETVSTGIMRRKSMLPKSRRVESLSENMQNEQANGGVSDNELPSTKEHTGGLGGEIEKISSRRRARLGTPETGSGDSPSRQPLQSVTNTNDSPRLSSSSESVALLKPVATEEVVRRARRRSTLFQSNMVGEV